MAKSNEISALTMPTLLLLMARHLQAVEPLLATSTQAKTWLIEAKSLASTAMDKYSSAAVNRETARADALAAGKLKGRPSRPYVVDRAGDVRIYRTLGEAALAVGRTEGSLRVTMGRGKGIAHMLLVNPHTGERSDVTTVEPYSGTEAVPADAYSEAAAPATQPRGVVFGTPEERAKRLEMQRARKRALRKQ